MLFIGLLKLHSTYVNEILIYITLHSFIHTIYNSIRYIIECFIKNIKLNGIEHEIYYTVRNN